METSLENKTALVNKSNILKPGFCCIGIVDTCVLKCQMCQKWKEDLYAAGSLQPTTEEWKTFIRQLRDLVDEGFEIDFGGGEALMRQDVLELVSYAKKLGFKNTIASNGYLIDKKMAKRIVDSGLDSIVLSLDSLKPKIHDRMRGVNGVASRVFKAIKYLRRYSKDIHIGICTIIMDQSLDGILDLAEWVEMNRNYVNSILFMAAMQPNNTVSKDSWYLEDYNFFWPKDTQKVHAVIDALIENRRLGHWIGNSVVQLEAFKSYYADPARFVKKMPCNLDRAVHVSSIGDIFLCYRYDLLGNIRKGGDIRQIWYSETAQKARDSIRRCQYNCHFLLNCFFEGDYPFILL